MSSPPPNNNNSSRSDTNDHNVGSSSSSSQPTQSQTGPASSSSTTLNSPPILLSLPIPPTRLSPSLANGQSTDTPPSGETRAGESAPPSGPLGSTTSTGGNNNGTISSMFWSFTIRPDTLDGPGPTTPFPHIPLGHTNSSSNQETNTNSAPDGNQEASNNNQPQQPNQRIPPGAPPPWLFPPFFNFFMPLRSEPRPDPEKAAELLRSLPTVGKNLMKRVNRIVAAEENDVTQDEDERGWKCGICLEGFDAEGAAVAKEGDVKDGAKADLEKRDEIQIDLMEEEKKKKEDEKEKRNGTGVKALPCNHLFHEDCLQPWFTTKHTCPSCRHDLDPLRTLNPPSTHPNPLRQGQTRLGRRSPHPYARDQPPNPNPARETENTASDAATAPEDAPAPTGDEGLRRLFGPGPGMIPSIGISGNGNPDEDHAPTITFIFSGSPPAGFNLPGLPTIPRPTPSPVSNPEGTALPNGPSPNAMAPAAHPTQNENNAATALQEGPVDPDAPAPSTPGSVFDVPTFFSSPLPMASRTSPSPAPDSLPSLSSIIGASSASIPSRTEPSTSSDPTTSAAPASSEGAAPATAGNTTEDRPRPERRPHITIIRTSSPSPAPGTGGTAPPPGSSGLGLGNLTLPPIFFQNLPPHIFNVGGTPSPGETQNNDNATAAPGTTGEANPAPQPQTTRDPTPFVPQSLESWTEEREKSLGWRCDAIECIYAPPTNEDEDVEMIDVDPLERFEEDDPSNKEMLSIYSPSRPPLNAEQREQQEGKVAIEGDDQDNGDNKDNRQFVLMTCQHKWHRKCLELSEKSSGRLFNPSRSADGRIWVKCEKCRKDGWVQSTSTTTSDGTGKKNSASDTAQQQEGNGIVVEDDEDYAPSEREVEDLVNF